MDLKVKDTVYVNYLDKKSLVVIVSITLVAGFVYTLHVTKPMFFVSLSTYNTSEKQPAQSRNKLQQHLVCIGTAGQLGNKMFVFASSYGIARSKGMKPVIPENYTLLKYFKLKVETYKINSSVCDPKRVTFRRERQASAFDKNLVNFNNTDDISLKTFLQSYLYFEKYKSEVRQHFIFKDEIQDTVNNIFSKIRQENNISRNRVTLVGVHVRRGYYVNNQIGFKGATKQYLHDAVQWYKSRFENLHFIVASNGMEWTKRNMPRHISVTYLIRNMPCVDMATVSSCNHFIATVGTFSWWCGWLTGGNVTYYKWPSKEGTKIRRTYSKDYKDYYYPEWIGL